MGEREADGRARRLADAFDHCSIFVRGQDEDRATANLFAAADRRSALDALYAFDIETAAIRDRVHQPIAGEIRLQWWRDTIAADGDGAGSPVAAALLDTIRRHDLPREAFERLLDARIFDLYDDPMPSREAFETYAGETASSIVTLAAMILDRSAAPRVAGLAGHAGVALTALAVAKNEARLRARGQVYVPAEILAAVGLDPQSYLAEGDPARARAALLAFAREHAGPVNAGWAGLPRSVRAAFLPLRAAVSRAARPDASPSRFDALKRTVAFWHAMRIRETRRDGR